MEPFDWFDQNGYVDEIIEPVDVRFLCEPEKIYLKPNMNYHFKVDKNCTRCVELAAVYE